MSATKHGLEPDDARPTELESARACVAEHADPALSELEAELEARLFPGGGTSPPSPAELPTALRIGLTLLASFGFASLVHLTARRQDFASYPDARFAVEAGALAIALTATLVFALRPSYVPALRRPVLATIVGVGLAVAFGIALVPPHEAEALGRISAPDWTAGMPCMVLGSLAGALVYVVTRAFDRGPANARWLAAAAGGLAANLVLLLHCPVGDVPHKLGAHASIGLLFLLCLAVALGLARRLGGARRAD